MRPDTRKFEPFNFKYIHTEWAFRKANELPNKEYPKGTKCDDWPILPEINQTMVNACFWQISTNFDHGYVLHFWSLGKGTGLIFGFAKIFGFLPFKLV